MSEQVVRGHIGNKEVVISTGKLAGQANGAVHVSMEETEVLVAATASAKPRGGVSFFPLTIDVEERMYAVGKIPGSFFRREGRATERATLSARLIDRPLRPSFRKGYRNDTHVVATVLQVDGETAYDVLALNGASAALTISDIPFEGPLGGVRMGLGENGWVPFPTFSELEECVFDLVVVGKRNESGSVDIIMVEAGATDGALALIDDGHTPPDEDAVAAGLEEAKDYIGLLLDLQVELQGVAGKEVGEWPSVIEYTDEVYERVSELAGDGIDEVVTIADKAERKSAEAELAERVTAEYGVDEDDADTARQVKAALRAATKKAMRRRIIDEGIRMDGRGVTELRQLTAEVNVLSRAHGSALFTRGETQVLNVVTLGMPRMEQMLDTISNEEAKRYMHHYNFPPYSTGEAGFMRGPKRREIGHGALAEKALLPVLPSDDGFQYTLRLVSEVLSSNGSSSMASVCGSSLSLMDAGVEIADPVAGIAMGLIADGDNYVTLTDILGAEDALGDMDFKVAGTADVITALQLDMKIDGLPAEVLAGALIQAKQARMEILDVMTQAIDGPRQEMKEHAPRLETVKIPVDKIGDIIGPKGKIIRELEADTGASIEVQDDGTVLVSSSDGTSLADALNRVNEIAFPPTPEVDKHYDGKVVSITDFGAFVNILPGKDGLLHISKFDSTRHVRRVGDYLSEGDPLTVVVDSIDRNSKVSLKVTADLEPKPGANVGAPGQRRDRGDRGPGRGGGGRGPSRGRGPRQGRGGGRPAGRGGGNRGRGQGGRGQGGRGQGGGSQGGGNRRRSGSTGSAGDGGRRFASFEDSFTDGI